MRKAATKGQFCLLLAILLATQSAEAQSDYAPNGNDPSLPDQIAMLSCYENYENGYQNDGFVVAFDKNGDMWCKRVNDCEFGCGMKGMCGTQDDCSTGHSILYLVVTGIFGFLACGLTLTYCAVINRYCCFKY